MLRRLSTIAASAALVLAIAGPAGANYHVQWHKKTCHNGWCKAQSYDKTCVHGHCSWAYHWHTFKQ